MSNRHESSKTEKGFFFLIMNPVISCFFFSFWHREPKDDNLEQELSLADKRNKREIRLLETEIPLWQVIVEQLNATSKFVCCPYLCC